MEIILLTGLILGLTSNFHCIGMCGPIALAIPVKRDSNLNIAWGVLQYNLGRILTYTLLGITIGFIGLSINIIGVLQVLSIIAGIGLIIFAWRKYFFKFGSNSRVSAKIQSLLSKGLGKAIQSKSPFRLIALGAINGLLPCGMVYAALLNAVLAGDLFGSGLAMTAFGVGTLPAMMAISFMANKINASMRNKMNNLVPYLLTVVGLLIVLRGMNLDIPYISPKVSSIAITNTETGETDSEIEMSCCHSKENCD